MGIVMLLSVFLYHYNFDFATGNIYDEKDKGKFKDRIGR